MKEKREERSIDREKHKSPLKELKELPSELELASDDLEYVAGGSPDLEPPGA